MELIFKLFTSAPISIFLSAFCKELVLAEWVYPLHQAVRATSSIKPPHPSFLHSLGFSLSSSGMPFSCECGDQTWGNGIRVAKVGAV